MRRSSVLLLIVCGCGGERKAVDVVQNWTAVEIKPGWGGFVDPDGDCKQSWKDGTLTIAVPAKAHELQGGGQRNAPRLLVERSGDFAMNVRVTGTLAPRTRASGSKFAPYHGAGIVVWEGEAAFIRMERAKILTPDGSELTYINFEAQGPNGGQPIKQLQLGPDESVHLRVERRGSNLVGLMSKDGSAWDAIGETSLKSSGPLKVGVAAVNSSNDSFAPVFSDFKFFERKKSS